MLQSNPYADITPYWFHPYSYYWPEGSCTSGMSHFMINNKRKNGPDFWENMRKVLRTDQNFLPIDHFRSWASTLIIPLASNIRFVEPCIAPILQQDGKYVEALIESWVGVVPDNVRYLRIFEDYNTSMTRCQNMYHLINFALHTRMDQFNSIIEIGGGYGDMSLLCRKLGFKGIYSIYDFPEMHKFQDYYLKSHGIDKTWFLDDPSELKVDTNFDPVDLVISTWALTEIPLELRNKLFERLKGSKNWLLAYEKNIFDIDNYSWIDDKFKDYTRVDSQSYFYKTVNSKLSYFHAL